MSATKGRWRALVNVSSAIESDVSDAADYIGQACGGDPSYEIGEELTEPQREAVEREMLAIARSLRARADRIAKRFTKLGQRRSKGKKE